MLAELEIAGVDFFSLNSWGPCGIGNPDEPF